MMPKNLVLVRHFRSEGNAAWHRSQAGDDSAYQGAFKTRAEWQWRLTSVGAFSQAQQVRDWLLANTLLPFERHMVSSHIRARETAGRLGLPQAEWFVDSDLRERDWGALARLSFSERMERFDEEMEQRELDPFGWCPPDGETFPALLLRVHRVFSTLAREIPDGDAILVTHGEWMHAARYLLERMLPEELVTVLRSAHVHDHIHNGQVLHYTRVDPESAEEHPFYLWVRSVCPTDLSRSSNEWRRIERHAFSNRELIAQAECFERLVDDVTE